MATNSMASELTLAAQSRYRSSLRAARKVGADITDPPSIADYVALLAERLCTYCGAETNLTRACNCQRVCDRCGTVSARKVSGKCTSCDDGYCYPCREHFDYRRRAACIDHVRPLSREGDHAVSNLVLACNVCNIEKGSRTLTEWPAWRPNGSERVDHGITRSAKVAAEHARLVVFERELYSSILAGGALCVFCGADAARVSHIYPLPHGGPTIDSNLIPTCPRCYKESDARTLTGDVSYPRSYDVNHPKRVAYGVEQSPKVATAYNRIKELEAERDEYERLSDEYERLSDERDKQADLDAAIKLLTESGTDAVTETNYKWARLHESAMYHCFDISYVVYPEDESSTVYGTWAMCGFTPPTTRISWTEPEPASKLCKSCSRLRHAGDASITATDHGTK